MLHLNGKTSKQTKSAIISSLFPNLKIRRKSLESDELLERFRKFRIN